MQNIRTFCEMFRQLLFILNQKQKKQFAFLVLGSIFVGLLETLGISVIIPYIMAMLSPGEFMQNQYVKVLIDIMGITEYFQLLLVVAVAIIFVYVLKSAIILLINFLQANFRNGLERDLSNKMLASYLHQDYLFHINTNSSEVVRGVHSDISGVASVVENFSSIASEGLTTLLIGVFLIYINTVMAIAVLALAGLTSLGIVVAFKKKMNVSGEKCRNAFQKKIQYIQQSENGIKDIIVKQKYDYFINKFAQYSEEACYYNTIYLTIAKVPNRVIEVVFITGLLLSSIFCIGRGGDTALYVTQLGAFAFAAVRILPSVSSMAVYMNNLIYFRPAVEATYRNLIEGVGSSYDQLDVWQMKEIPQNNGAKFQDRICLENIKWRYADDLDYVLDNASLEIQKGEAVGIIGTSGAGKTTLIDILLGLLRPESGTITIDGKDIFINSMLWAKKVGYVPQSLFLLDDTVRRNIAFGVPEEEINDDKIEEVMDEAQLRDIVDHLPNGLDTELGEQGMKVSGGQRQRIAIARALYFEPDILILDEATSALDQEIERAVMGAIDALHGRKTLVIVAHRLSTLRKCDRIYEVKDKKILPRDKEEVLNER